MAVEERLTSLNVSLPESLKAFVEQQVAAGHYVSASEYIRELLRAASDETDRRERLEGLLVEGLESGEPLAATPSYWAKKRKALGRKR